MFKEIILIKNNPAYAGFTPHMHSPANAGDFLRGRYD